VNRSLSLLCCMACAPRWGGVEAFEPPATLTAPCTLALVGASDPVRRGLVDDVAHSEADRVVLLPGAVADVHPSDLARVRRRWSAHTTWWAPDPRLLAHDAAAQALWPGDAWSTLDIALPEAKGPMRWLMLDPRDPREQRFWLAGAVAAAPHLVVVLPTEQEALRAAVVDAASPAALAAFVRGDGGVNALLTPSGRWGRAEVVAADGGASPVPLQTEGLNEAFRADLIDRFGEEVPASRALHEAGEPFRPPAFATTGWWRVDVEVDGTSAWSLRRRGADGRWHTVHRATHHPDRGWQASE
jgi:hypothetical protein